MKYLIPGALVYRVLLLTMSISSSWSINARMEMLRQNEVMAQMQALARKSGVTCDDISESLTDVAISRHRTGASTSFTRSTDEHVRDLMFNSAIREIFLHYFLQVRQRLLSLCSFGIKYRVCLFKLL